MLIRRGLTGWLVALTLTGAWFATIALWVRGDVLNAKTFSTETSQLLDDPSVRLVVTDRLSDEVVEAEPQLEPFRVQIHAAVDVVVGSPAFEAIFADAVAQAHRAVFSGTGEPVQLDLAGVEPLVTQSVQTIEPSAVAFLPPADTYRTITVIGAGDLPTVADQADWIRDAAPLVGLAAAVCAGLAVLVSARRPGTLRMIGFGLIVIAGMAYGTVWLIRRVLLDRVTDPRSRSAADTVVGVATDAFVRRCILLGLLGLAVAAAGFVLSALLRSLRSGRDNWKAGSRSSYDSGAYYDTSGYQGPSGYGATGGYGSQGGYSTSGYGATGVTGAAVPSGPVDRRRPGGTYL